MTRHDLRNGPLAAPVVASRGWRWRERACTVALLAFPAVAHAYVDSGNASLLFQSLLAILFGVGAGWRRLRAWMLALVRRGGLFRHRDKG